MSQEKKASIMYGAVGQSALMATRTLLSMNHVIGMSLPYPFSPNSREKNWGHPATDAP